MKRRTISTWFAAACRSWIVHISGLGSVYLLLGWLLWLSSYSNGIEGVFVLAWFVYGFWSGFNAFGAGWPGNKLIVRLDRYLVPWSLLKALTDAALFAVSMHVLSGVMLLWYPDRIDIMGRFVGMAEVTGWVGLTFMICRILSTVFLEGMADWNDTLAAEGEIVEVPSGEWVEIEFNSLQDLDESGS